jgi:hypothetical protein
MITRKKFDKWKEEGKAWSLKKSDAIYKEKSGFEYWGFFGYKLACHAINTFFFHFSLILSNLPLSST